MTASCDLTSGIPSQDTGPGVVYARIEEAGHNLASFTEEVGVRMPAPKERRPVEMTDTVKSAPNYVLEYSFPAT